MLLRRHADRLQAAEARDLPVSAKVAGVLLCLSYPWLLALHLHRHWPVNISGHL